MTSAFDHEENMDGQSDKQGHTRTDRAAIYGRSDQKESPVGWTPQEDVTKQATKGQPRLQFKDTIKRNLKQRDKWRAIVM